MLTANVTITASRNTAIIPISVAEAITYMMHFQLSCGVMTIRVDDVDYRIEYRGDASFR